MKLRLTELQVDDKQAKDIRWKKLTKSCEIIDKVLYHQNFLYVAKIIYLKLINCHPNNLLARHFRI